MHAWDSFRAARISAKPFGTAARNGARAPYRARNAETATATRTPSGSDTFARRCAAHKVPADVRRHRLGLAARLVRRQMDVQVYVDGRGPAVAGRIDPACTLRGAGLRATCRPGRVVCEGGEPRQRLERLQLVLDDGLAA